MEQVWVARLYKYADGVPWNDDRYELFVQGDNGEWVSVGGAIRNWSHRTVAFLCPQNINRTIRTPQQAETLTDGVFVVGVSVMDALNKLKLQYPDPLGTLAKLQALKNDLF